ncbi:MAG: HlyD family efflux transporter periplasmic adaptor subunit [Synechococcaceae cyanobacterium RL_1_2]|nr:HlyD family efflux transporter periplasmic adaptor subunit [Synechococcaceae cyanobacterium RL_1_2]
MRDTAKKRLDQEEATLGLEIARLESNLQELEANLFKIKGTLTQQIEEAKANLTRIKEIRPVDIQKAEAELGRAKAALSEAEADLELAFIRSPIAGTVLQVNVQPGETINQTEGVIQVGQTDQMLVVAEVYESDISLVEVGQKATITSEGGSFTGSLGGTVLTVGRQVAKKDVLDTDPTADVDTRVIEVEVLIDPQDSDLVKNLTYSKVIADIHL